MKKLIAILLAAMLMCSLAVSAGAILPIFGTSSLTITQDGKPVAGIAVELYRVNTAEDKDDTLVGTYVTQADGTVRSSRLSQGLYYWQDTTINIKETFSVLGGKTVKRAAELPTSFETTFAVDGNRFNATGEVTITADLSGGWMAEFNEYGTLYLYQWVDGSYLVAVGYLCNQQEYETAAEAWAEHRIEAPDDMDAFHDAGELGGIDCFQKLADGIYFYGWMEEGMSPNDMLSRLKIRGSITIHEDPVPEETDWGEGMSYMSPDGYQIYYNALQVESRDTGEHSAEFIYLPEGDGENKVTVSWVADKQPEELLYEVTARWGDQTAITRYEGFFPGTTDKWGYWRMFATNESVKCAIAGEYNGGVLMFVIERGFYGDEETEMVMNDVLAELVDSITYFDFGPQTMYDYFPGVYKTVDESGAVYQVVLNEDHTGTVTLQDTVNIVWGSTELNASDVFYPYTIEGDNLYLKLDNNWIEFAREIVE